MMALNRVLKSEKRKVKELESRLPFTAVLQHAIPILLLPAVSLLLFSSCSNPNLNEILPGTWEVASVETVMPSISPALTQEADHKELNTVYHFGNDGFFSIEGPDIVGSYTGHWEYNTTDSTIRLSYVRTIDTLEYSLKVDAWRRNQIVLTQSYNELGYTKFVFMRSK